LEGYSDVPREKLGMCSKKGATERKHRYTQN
jgi:hypothetical protein